MRLLERELDSFDVFWTYQTQLCLFYFPGAECKLRNLMASTMLSEHEFSDLFLEISCSALPLYCPRAGFLFKSVNFYLNTARQFKRRYGKFSQEISTTNEICVSLSCQLFWHDLDKRVSIKSLNFVTRARVWNIILLSMIPVSFILHDFFFCMTIGVLGRVSLFV